ncbi:MAG: type 1 glutamine amidotransferase [Methylophilus sp.]|jgi:GMP synthase-like glutamine amidotransferase
MKPVVVFRHALCEGAGYLGTFLEQHDIPWCEVRIDLGETLPASASAYSGLVFMGGPMSVNDDLPWISETLALIREAVALDIPVLGHCLGGQLMSKALGAEITANHTKEIGWGEVFVGDNAQAKNWFGNIERFVSFHWHGETFDLPQAAQHLLSSQYCQNQAWSMGKHFAMQCHIEMTEDMVQAWCNVGQQEIQASLTSPGVQSADTIVLNAANFVADLNQQAKVVYTQWIKGLRF